MNDELNDILRTYGIKQKELAALLEKNPGTLREWSKNGIPDWLRTRIYTALKSRNQPPITNEPAMKRTPHSAPRPQSIRIAPKAAPPAEPNPFVIYMANCKMSSADAAQILGVSERTVHRWRNGDTTPPHWALEAVKVGAVKNTRKTMHEFINNEIEHKSKIYEMLRNSRESLNSLRTHLNDIDASLTTIMVMLEKS